MAKNEPAKNVPPTRPKPIGASSGTGERPGRYL